MARLRPPVRRLEGDRFAVELGSGERDLIGSLIGQLRELLTEGGPATVRLFPPPYGDDEERNAGYAALAGSELHESRHAALDVVESTLHASEIDQGALEAWMRSLNDLRLVLSVVLEIDEDGRPEDLSEDNAATYAAYELLGALLELIVEALAE